jgi:hypothetical protein
LLWAARGAAAPDADRADADRADAGAIKNIAATTAATAATAAIHGGHRLVPALPASARPGVDLDIGMVNLPMGIARVSECWRAQ